MSSERAGSASATRTSADPSGQPQGRTLAGLIDVLDRADVGLMGQSPRPRRTAAHRPAGTRSGGVRTAPLRSVQPAPMARRAAAPPLAGPVRVSAELPVPARTAGGRWRALTRRAALWGAGPQGEHLAWRRPAPRVRTPAATPAQAVAPRSGRIRRLVRQVAHWGAGSGGRYLAWGGPARPAVGRNVDPPIVLREMPSIPTIQPAAPSPAAALLSRGPASPADSREMPPVPRGAVAVPGTRPGGPPERSRATGRPSQARLSQAATGLVRARGDPLSYPVRGSPPPARRSRSPDSAWSSLP
jgi:hypothetical protein